MKAEQLKLYNKYKHDKQPDREYIFIGKGNNNHYWFIYRHKNFNMNFNINVNFLNVYGLNSKQIIKDLKLETYLNNNGKKRIKGYDWDYLNEENLIYFKPLLKDKLKNIINR